ncbi:hypothetical protein ALMA_1049 [Alloscardovia macacae]|uniref:Uncharacterized protein n=1 Tax=Alloscardovia macacae TaxID=1160091 RepID=A0A261F3U7_9BIFI|nr:hypothetical protein ALMA_1049 [Alloscardovia macacae]
MRDVATAFKSIYMDAQRANGHWIAVGTDSRLRDIEMIYFHDYKANSIVIYRAFTPPTTKFLTEIHNLKRRRI